MKRYVYREEAKCNFCSDWFLVFTHTKFGLNICEKCIEKALTTSQLKIPGPHQELYQLYLVKMYRQLKQEKESDEKETTVLVDDFMHEQFRKMMKKWEQISDVVQGQMSKDPSQEAKKKIKTVLEEDSREFHRTQQYILNRLKGNYTFHEPKTPEKYCTPLTQKNQNIPLKNSYRSVKRSNSKGSLMNLSKQNGSASIKRSIYLNTGNKNQCSQFAVTSLSRLEHGQQLEEQKIFTSRMHKLKNSINSFLQNEQSVNPVLQNIMREKIYEAIQNTNIMNKCIELVSYQGLQEIDFKCYLNNIDWEGIQVVKFVRVGLTDDQLKEILSQIEDKGVQTLVLTGNSLTEQAISELLKADIESLKNVYLSKNQIFGCKAKSTLRELKEKYNVYM